MRLDLATHVNGGRATRGGRARTARLLATGFGALCLALFATSAAASARVGRDYTCSGGNIPAGSYESIKVTGVCYMPAGTITVERNVTVERGALLDALSPGDPPSSPLVAATVLINGSVVVEKDGAFVMGCSPNNSCPQGINFDHIRGNVTAHHALGVVIQQAEIGGNVTVEGGGGGAAGGPSSGGCFNTHQFPIPAPWSEDHALSNGDTGSPQYTDFEDNSIGGSLRIVGQQTCWIGSFRNQIAGSMTIADNVTSDPDGMETVNNLVAGHMSCGSNLPAVQFGDAAGTSNIVGGDASGECSFNEIALNPVPPAPGGVAEHISVAKSSLHTYEGTRSATGVETHVFGVTESGNTLLGQTATATFGGSGLTGTAMEKTLVTVFPDGSSAFNAIDKCSCRLAGESGMTRIRAYGRSSADGLTTGTFLIVAGGAGLGDFGTLAGYGTFTSAGEPQGTLKVVEHLGLN
jgi:hypothetical protein